MARRTGRPTGELLHLYALEGFLDRLSRTEHADTLVLKGGMLLAVRDARRPTRDIDLAARPVAGEVEPILEMVRHIAWPKPRLRRSGTTISTPGSCPRYDCPR